MERSQITATLREIYRAKLQSAYKVENVGIEDDCWDKSERILKCTWTQTHGKVRLFDLSHDADFGSASMRAHLSDLQINSVYGECIQSLHFRSLRNS